MRAYRTVIVGAVAVAIILGLIIIGLNDTGAAAAVSIEFVAIVVLDVIASVYVVRLVRADRRRPRSWLLLSIASNAAQITFGLGLITLLLVRRLLGFAPLGLTFTTDVYAIALWLIGIVPVEKALLFWLVQREGINADLETRRFDDNPTEPAA